MCKYKMPISEFKRSLDVASGATTCANVVIIGGGIIGTSIARRLKELRKNVEVLLLEKECRLARHQSSHNSGVVHSGVYYNPGSLKARFCVEGAKLLEKYCNEKNIQYRKNGKLVLAKDCTESNILKFLYERGVKNNVTSLEILTSLSDVRKICSGCCGVQALWSPNTANVNFGDITNSFGNDFLELGGFIVYNFEVEDIQYCGENTEYPISVIGVDNNQIIKAKYIVICGGLQSETLTNLYGPKSHLKFLSLRVNYKLLKAEFCGNLATNVYPVPDLTLPFLGAHFSPHPDGNVLLGPSAVPALKLEGYKCNELNLDYLKDLTLSCGFRNMVLRNFSKCVDQVAKVVFPDIQIKELQQLIPNFSYQFVREGPIAIQCQALKGDGTFVDDFLIDVFEGNGITSRIINVKFAPSPAATSAMAIANFVIEELMKKLRAC
ncbi:L-2-hydroxyglutarate dehydrogenase, mitochondrial-like isoform X2 [Cylas formicarius]|uniref:L-2-hydroxyglutarate dehydrogenase, mitochondrial-like isoform X2 n=1 Tax=Cylas formicarius TaxID=197179 RepID=UPI002958D48D|nr:L-2-hydroxyglutarate dehydrogenase, mitochondrial-like isoform X2 [Cylas formicarius]